MNLRNVLKTYSLLRSLTDDESALLETLRAMNDSERELLVKSLAPAKATTKKPAKKPATTREYDHCLRCGTTKRDSSHKDQASPDYHEFQSSQGKSARAVKLAEQIKGAGKLKTVCAFVYADGSACNQSGDNPIHEANGGYAGYHEFQPAEQVATGAGA
jgi:hypothetical protein